MSESAGRVIAKRADGIGGVDRMYDSQWVNVVNHDNCYHGWDENDAIAHAVRMTEKYMAENNAAFRKSVLALADQWWEERSRLLALAYELRAKGDATNDDFVRSYKIDANAEGLFERITELRALTQTPTEVVKK